MNNLMQLYSKFYDKFGAQGWWPVAKKGSIKPSYHNKELLTETQKLEICFGAILTQNTNWKNVEKAIINLNKEKLIDIRKINKVNQEELAGLIRSAGYFNQKAVKLKVFCEYLERNYDSSFDLFFKKPIKELREELLSIKGIGPETADSIILYAAQKPMFVVDAYTKRIMHKLGYCDENVSYDELQKMFTLSLPKDVKLFNEYHALLVQFGKEHCRKKAKCEECFLRNHCNQIHSNPLKKS
ncbi:MAG: endonuclease III domain-containing protein [Candidatus Woesearchaeota archaeon]|jgi:endonuclease-3 related protein|nr:endonuclease III domain-containing protein [Candidatus Woesearchaeota archaeon]|tara:strand:+ start:5091 stop:5813 length:723 start_codon:yes stop_codon:yes gene_type:complete